MFQGHEIVRRLKLNLGAHFIGYLTVVLNQLFLLPVFLHYWPAAVYGEWLVLFALPSYAALSDFGMETVGGNRICIAGANGEIAKANIYLHTYFVFQTTVLFSIFTVVAAIVYCGQLSHWLSIELFSPSTVSWTMMILIARTLLLCQEGLFRTIYRANFLAARGTFVMNMSRLGEFIITVLVIVLGHGVIVLALALLAVQVVTISFMYMDSRRTCPQYHIGWRYFSMGELRLVLKEGLAFQLIPGSMALTIQGMTMMVNYILGPEAVVAYNAIRAICRASFVALQMIGWAVHPEISILYGSGDISRMSRVFKLTMQVSTWITIIVVIAVLGMGKYILLLLTHGIVHAPMLLLTIFTAGIITTGFWNSASVLLVSTNHHMGFSKYASLASIFLLGISIPLMTIFGLYGAPVATLAMDLILCPYVWNACRKLCGYDPQITLVHIMEWPTPKKIVGLFADQEKAAKGNL